MRFYRWYDGLLAALLTFLGYGCSLNSPEDMYGVPVEYGVPVTSFKVVGTVTDESGKPIPGIQTKIQRKIAEQEHLGADSTKTDAEGAFSNQFSTSSVQDLQDYRLIVEDVDGAENGEFKSDTLSLEALERKQISQTSSSWKKEYELKAEVKLKKK